MRFGRESFWALTIALWLGFHGVAFATPVSIGLTTDDLGLGSTKINHAGNNSAVEADRPGQLVTSTASNVGSILYVQTDNLAGQGTITDPLLVTITGRTYLSIQDNLPTNSDLHGGVISLTKNSGTLKKDGLGIRAFAVDTSGTEGTNSNFGRRYVNPSFVPVNVNGFQMEGSKEISGGIGITDFDDFVAGNSSPPHNNPPHVDEDVLFDFNDAELIVPAGSINLILTKIKAGSPNDVMDLALNVIITLVGGTIISNSYDYLSDAPDVFSLVPGETEVIQMDFGGASLGLSASDKIDSFIIGAREDPADPDKETDEHFLINGLTASYVAVPEPATVLFVTLGLAGLGMWRRH